MRAYLISDDLGIFQVWVEAESKQEALDRAAQLMEYARYKDYIDKTGETLAVEAIREIKDQG